LAALARQFPIAVAWLFVAAVLVRVAGRELLFALVAVAATAYLMALALRRAQRRSADRLRPRRMLLAMVAAHLAAFVWLTLDRRWGITAVAALGVAMCHAISYLVDVYRGDAETRPRIDAGLYLLQLPVIFAGPLSRYRDFTAQLKHGTLTLGAFAYGVRRIVTGLIKAVAVGGTLAAAADAIFAAPAGKLTAAAAWLGACCYSLQVYLQYSGLCDMGIGIGRMVGLRYQENFRRPYTADSVREFWRRWNVTLITWLRDYLSLPIAGHDEPTLGLYVNIVAGFCLVGLWHHGSATFVIWGVYCGTWLALEAIGFGSRLERWPAAARHVYVLAVVLVGWVILRAPHVADLSGYLKAMAGFNRGVTLTAGRYLDVWVWTALGVGAFAAGPMVPSVSRWRVSVDAATTSLLMMLAATGLFLWRGPSMVLRSMWASRAEH
jgi:alginate O-acetyltransferase complex protein AlgI